MRKFVFKKQGYLNSWWLWRWHFTLRVTWFVSFVRYVLFQRKERTFKQAINVGRWNVKGRLLGWVGFGRLSDTGSLCQLTTALLNFRDSSRHIVYMRKKTCCTFPKIFLSVCATGTRTLPVGMQLRHENTVYRYSPQTWEQFLSVCPTDMRKLPVGMPQTWEHVMSVCLRDMRTLPVGMPHRHENTMPICPTDMRKLPVGMPQKHEKTAWSYAPQTWEHFLPYVPADVGTFLTVCPNRHVPQNIPPINVCKHTNQDGVNNVQERERESSWCDFS